jgi:hypothetical protein
MIMSAARNSTSPCIGYLGVEVWPQLHLWVRHERLMVLPDAFSATAGSGGGSRRGDGCLGSNSGKPNALRRVYLTLIMLNPSRHAQPE